GHKGQTEDALHGVLRSEQLFYILLHRRERPCQAIIAFYHLVIRFSLIKYYIIYIYEFFSWRGPPSRAPALQRRIPEATVRLPEAAGDRGKPPVNELAHASVFG